MYLGRNDDRLLSPCCGKPQNVSMGEPTGTPSNWMMPVIHECSICGREFDPETGTPGPGTMWMEKHPESKWRPEPATHPEGT